MDKYILTDSDVQVILQKNNINANSIIKLPRSGQRQVFEITFNTGNSSMLKFIDISPYWTFESFEWNEVTEDELEEECKFEIEARSKRIIRELEASKRCPILPQLEIFDGFQTVIKGDYRFIFYFETKFEGDTLNNSEIYKNDQDIDMVINFLMQMVEQIKVMHEAGYVHRDLTPRNIIFSQGHFNIIDAGLVKSNNEEKITATLIQIGTPRYMAPEQKKRSSDYLWDYRTDLYPLGLIAIEIFLPKTRRFSIDVIRDLHYIYPIWKEKDSSERSINLFSKIITRLAIEQRHRRWSDLDELLEVLRNLNKKEGKQ